MSVDYTKFGPNGPPNTGVLGGLDRRWWTLKGEDAAGSIAATVKFLHEHQGQRLTQHVISSRLYGNVSVMGLNGLSISRMASVQSALKDRISYNVVASAIDTIVAKLAKNKPRPLFLTSGGDYRLQRKAKKLNKFVDGVFYENTAYDLGTQLFRDACVFGDGIAHVYACNGRVKYERQLPSEIYVDEIEGFYGEPRSLHRVKNIDRLQLAEMFPGNKALISRANQARADETGNQANVSDMVTVRESWHLPSGPDASDGKHMLTLDGGVIFSEAYDRATFPFAFLRWSKRLFGFWGQGLAEQLQNLQLEINKLLWVIQRSLHLAGSFKILIENTSKIVKEHLANDIGAIVSYSGTPPQYVTPPAVQPELYQHLATLKQAAFEQAGISMLSAASQKPAGLNSGKALREYNDIESDRFMTVGHAYEKFFIDLARLSISVAKDITEEEGGYSVSVPASHSFIETIDFKDVDMDEADYVIQAYPVSSLPNEPAGRLETVQEYAQAGFISPRQARKLLDFPDIEAAEGLDSAKEQWIESILERIIDDGEYTAPDPFDDLQLARELALNYYQQGKLQKLEDERLEMLRTFITQIDALEAMAMPPPAPGVAAPGSQPMAAPEPTPTSNLVPNAMGAPNGVAQ